MKTNENQTTSTIYYRPLKQWIEATRNRSVTGSGSWVLPEKQNREPEPAAFHLRKVISAMASAIPASSAVPRRMLPSIFHRH